MDKNKELPAKLRGEIYKAEQHGNPLDSSEIAIRAQEIAHEPTQADFEREMLRESALEMANLELLDEQH